jgi:hypothetical protein
MSITIYEAAVARGVKSDETGAINGAEFYRVGLPFFGGCERCGASMGPGQAHPSQTGYLRCTECIIDLGFETPEDFEAWCATEDDE